jgi:predicted GIY-YIG superfamily endonuclease
MQQPEFVYVLECASGDPLQSSKYYVGRTFQPEIRLPAHFNGQGSEWTKRYRPLRTINIFKMISQHDEDNTTKDLMGHYGIANVRGGSYSNVELGPSQVLDLQRQLKSAKGICYLCDRAGHLAKDCPQSLPSISTAVPISSTTTPAKSNNTAHLQKWTPEDDAKLKVMGFNAVSNGTGVSRKLVYDLSVEFKRTYPAIIFRLHHLGIVNDQQKAKLLEKPAKK